MNIKVGVKITLRILKLCYLAFINKTSKMGIKILEIYFNKSQKVYLPNETVSGNAKVVTDVAKTIRGLEFCCKGEARISWNRYKRFKWVKSLTTYMGDEEYFETKYFLLGGENEEVELPPGEHIYPFNFVLPLAVPTSFEDSTGYIRYIVKITLMYHWETNQKVQSAFTVIAPKNLNLTPHLKKPVTKTSETSFCCLWCKSNALKVSVSLSCSGYVPGQAINIVCNVHNSSNVGVENVTFILKQKIVFRSTYPKKAIKIKKGNIVSKSHSVLIPAKKNHCLIDNLVVPSLPPSNLMSCSLIDVDYQLEIIVKISGFHADMSMKFPVIIGTVPIQEAAEFMPTTTATHVDVNIIEQPSNALSKSDFELISPTTGNDALLDFSDVLQTVQNTYFPQNVRFEESHFRKPQQLAISFKPLYPVYTFQ